MLFTLQLMPANLNSMGKALQLYYQFQNVAVELTTFETQI